MDGNKRENIYLIIYYSLFLIPYSLFLIPYFPYLLFLILIPYSLYAMFPSAITKMG